MVYSVFFVVFIVCAPSFALTKIECVLKDGSVYAYNITVKFLLSSLQNVFFFVAKSNFFFKGDGAYFCVCMFQNLQGHFKHELCRSEENICHRKINSSYFNFSNRVGNLALYKPNYMLWSDSFVL